MANHEKRLYIDNVHLYLAFARNTHGEKVACIRTVIKGGGWELDCLESKLKIMGGYWRIHKTVNARDVEKSRKWLLKKLIDIPEMGSCIDSVWRTGLLQDGHVFGQKRFMFDIDTEDKNILKLVKSLIPKGSLSEKHKSPKGWHYLVLPFDTREICKIKEVTMLRDGYYFVKEIGIRRNGV